MTEPHWSLRYPTVTPDYDQDMRDHDAYFEALAAEPCGVIGAEAVAESIRRDSFPAALLGWLGALFMAIGAVCAIALIGA